MNRKWKTILIVSLLGNLAICYVAYKAYMYREYINYWLDRYDHAVAKFSGRAIYGTANLELSAADPNRMRVVFFGTQVTTNWNLDDYFGEYETVNRGVDSQWVAGYLLRFRPDVIELSPDAVVIEVSSYNFRPNVTSKEIVDYVVSMAELARANGIVPILTTTIPPTSDFSVYEHPDYTVKDTVNQYSTSILEYGSGNAVLVADWRKAVADADGYLRPELASGQVDLNDDGYATISETISRVLAGLERPQDD